MRRFQVAALAVAALLAVPALARAQAAEEMVTCKDGSTSHGGKGACSGHGGVDKKATKAAKTGAEAATKAATTAAAPAPAGQAEETVTCKDGTTSKAGRGACRGHGGVDKGAAKGAAKAAPAASAATTPAAPPPAAAAPPAAAPPRAAPAPAATPQPPVAAKATAPANAKNTDATGAIARCKDGTYSHAKSHTGACSRHGGVADWLDKPAPAR